MDWLLSIFGLSPTVSLNAREQDQTLDNIISATMTNNKSTCIDEGGKASRSKSSPAEGDSQHTALNNSSRTRTTQGTATPSQPHDRSPPNSPARPIGPPESWYAAASPPPTSPGESTRPHPHPLRSNPIHSTNAAAVAGPQLQEGTGVHDVGESGAAAADEISADDRQGRRPHSQSHGAAEQASKSESKKEKSGEVEVETGDEEEWKKGASGLGPGEAWYA